MVQEKKKLESIENIHLSNSIEVEWKEIEMKLQELLKGIDDETDFDDLTDTEDASEEDMINIVGNYLCDGQYKQAISLLVKLKNEFYKTFKIKKENFCSETIIGILLQVFKEKKKLSLLSVAPDVQEKIEKHSKTIEYLESTLEFSELIDRALPIILTFLDSNVITDVLEAIHFFSAAYLFGFKKALEGVRKMLQLVFSKENSIKTAVSDAYKDIYFQKSGSERSVLSYS